MHSDYRILQKYKKEIDKFLIENLKIELHPDKTKIIKLRNGISLLGYRVFYYHKLLRKANKRKFGRKFKEKLELYKTKEISYENFMQNMQGWNGYAMWANTHKMRKDVLRKIKN